MQLLLSGAGPWVSCSLLNPGPTCRAACAVYVCMNLIPGAVVALSPLHVPLYRP